MTPVRPVPPRRLLDRVVLFVAQGFGAGLLPKGPGTWGSLVGLAYLVALLAGGHAWIWCLVNGLGVLIAVGLCTRAETLLGQPDPASVVLDEIVAVPLTFLGPWLALGGWPANVSGRVDRVLLEFWPELLTSFLAFRLFDIWKPGPIGRIQHLPRGWGIVADDVVAALAAAVVTGGVTILRHP